MTREHKYTKQSVDALVREYERLKPIAFEDLAAHMVEQGLHSPHNQAWTKNNVGFWLRARGVTIIRKSTGFDRDRIRAMLEEGASDQQITDATGCAMMTLQHIRHELGFLRGPRRTPYTDAENARIKQLADEGMPATWIADDVGRSAAVLRKRMQSTHPMSMDARKAWSEAWQFIRRRPEIYALHKEFAPKGVE